MTSVLETQELGKRYGRRWALQDCTLAIPQGKVVGLVGPNGAGKTTLLHLAVGLLAPTAGTITVLGAPPADGPTQLGRVGFVAQDTPTYARMSVAHHLRMGAMLNPTWDDEMAERRIDQLGLDPRQRAGLLSGGQRAQLALTLAISKRPELLVLDEPVASLDPLARREFLQHLMEVVAEHGVTVVLSSHLVADLERICDYLIVLTASHVQLAGDVDTLVASHHRLSGPRRDSRTLPEHFEIIEESHTDKQSVLLVRTDEPILDPAWTVTPVTMDDLVLGYMSQGARRETESSIAIGGRAMIRFTWLQARTQATLMAAALIIVAAALAVTGPHIVDLYNANVATSAANGTCDTAVAAFLENDRRLREWLSVLVVVLPGVIGLFWGAPLVARELETGTFRLAWTQSVTRARWLAVKLAVVGLLSMASAGLLSLMVSWWAGPFDQANANRFVPGQFDARGLVAIGYVAFAFALGVTAGVVIKRILPAMVTTLIAFVFARLAVIEWLRPNLGKAAQRVIALDPASVGFGRTNSGPFMLQPEAPDIPNAWILSTRVVDNAGHAIPADYVTRVCPLMNLDLPKPVISGERVRGPVPTEVHNALTECVTKIGDKFHAVVTYHPAKQYWIFQLWELAIFLGAALMLCGLCFWWVRRRLA